MVGPGPLAGKYLEKLASVHTDLGVQIEQISPCRVQTNSIFHFDQGTVCPRSSDPIYIVSYYINMVKTSWT